MSLAPISKVKQISDQTAPDMGAGGKGVKVAKQIDSIADARVPGVDGIGATGQEAYPSQYLEADRDMDRKMAIRKELAADEFTVAAGDREVDYLKKKEDQVARMDFESWLADRHLAQADPAMQRLIHSAYPEYWQGRMQQLERDLDLTREVAKIKMVGPQSREDFFLQYAMETNQIKLPRAALWSGPIDGGRDVPTAIDGIFNSRRSGGQRISSFNAGLPKPQAAGYIPGSTRNSDGTSVLFNSSEFTRS